MRSLILTVLLVSSQALAVCDHETSLRDKSKDLCLISQSATTVVSLGAGMGVATGKVHPAFLGVIVVPALFMNNQCRIYKEREEQLAACMNNHREERKAQVKKNQDILDDLTSTNDQIEAINTRYNQLEADARQRHQSAVRALGTEFLRQGRNLRDPAVQEELRVAIRELEANFARELINMNSQRMDEINAL